MNTKRYLVPVLLMACLAAKAQQDPQYSMYQFNQMVINPAYAGSRDALSVVVDARQQWSGFDGAPRTQSFSLHGPLKKKRIGLGLSGYSDQIGPQKSFGAYGSFAYIIPVTSKLKLSMGLRAGLVSYSFDFSRITYKDQSESFVGYNQGQRTRFDADAGIYLKSNSFFTGISVTHLNQPSLYHVQDMGGGATSTAYSNINYTLDPHLFFIIGKAFSLGDNLVFNPTFLLKSTKASNGMDLNLNFLIRQRVWLGAFVRTDHTIGALAQVYITERLRIGYAFDTSGNSIQKRLGNGHEIMIGFDFNTFKSKMLSPRTL